MCTPKLPHASKLFITPPLLLCAINPTQPTRHKHRSDLPNIDPLAATTTANLMPFWVIGNDAGWYPQLQPSVTSLEMGPAQRFDVIIDFSGAHATR